ncbi:MAG TPA: MotA/TolQ/ExbB proton channel family protein [Lentisphaeria bacterium]|nr:MotA/TolQ/ExbB proton channel family protein [Lentisphaeria bacterium]
MCSKKIIPVLMSMTLFSSLVLAQPAAPKPAVEPAAAKPAEAKPAAAAPAAAKPAAAPAAAKPAAAKPAEAKPVTAAPAAAKPAAAAPAAATPAAAAPAAAKPAAAKPAEAKPAAAKPAAAQVQAPAPEATDAPGAADAMPTLTFRKIMVDGGFIMNWILGLSFIAIALIFFYLLTMRSGVMFPKKFIMAAQDAAENGDLETLRDLCRESNSPASKIIQASLEQIIPGQPLDYERVKDAMEDEGVRQAGFLWQRLQYLMDVAVISPMVGLLGTVWGMMVSFSGLEAGMNFINKADALASGVAQAMYTTFGGLIVGIFAMASYDLLRGRLFKLLSGMESACGTVLHRLVPAKTSAYARNNR